MPEIYNFFSKKIYQKAWEKLLLVCIKENKYMG